MTVHCQLIASQCDFGGYITYVFVNVDKNIPYYSKYIMCVRFPNWEHNSIAIGDVGYLKYEEHIAGKDEWWDGTQFIKYNYDMVQFMKFVPEPKEQDKIEYLI